jgi:hypothetical protein
MSNLLVNVAFRSSDVAIELERNALNVSDANMLKVLKNNATRLKACSQYTKASIETLEFIVKHSSVSIDELMNFSNVKSANRMLTLANSLISTKQDNAQNRVVSALNSALKSYDAIPFSVIHLKFGGAEMMLKSLLRVRMMLGLLVRVDNQDYKATINNDTTFKIV